MNNENNNDNSNSLITSEDDTNLNEMEPVRATRTKKTKTTMPEPTDQERKIIQLSNSGFDVNRIAAMLMVGAHKVREVLNKF